MSRTQFHALGSYALRGASAFAIIAAGGGAAWADSSSDISDGAKIAAIVPYDMAFIRTSGDSQPQAKPVALAQFRGQSRERLITVNGVEFGTGTTGILDDKLYLSSNLAAVAGFECGEMVQAGDDSLCAVGARNFWTDGDRLFINQAGSGGSANYQETAPELAQATLGFLNYDTNFIVDPNGGMAIFGSLEPGLRVKENAFDVKANYYQQVRTGGTQAAAQSQISVSSFAYRREWFERRLRLIAGRTQSLSRGVLGGEQFDGISLQRFNSDDTGGVPTAGPRPITGFAAGPGVLQYRVGDKVYKQLPLREGKFEVSGDFMSDAPRGGRLEFVGLDGVARELSIPSDIYGNYSLYRPGDFSFDIQAGRLSSLDGDRPFGAIGGRYGVTRDLSVDLGFSTTDQAFSFGGAISSRLPGALGALNLSAATSRRWSGAGSAFASTIDASYFNRFGELSFDVSHRQYFNGGFRGLGATSNLVVSSGITQTTRASISVPVPVAGDDISLRAIGERTRYRDAPQDSNSIQVDLSRSFGNLGSGMLAGRYGRDQYGRSYSTLMLNWSVSFGGRNGLSLNGTTTKSEGGARENRYGATFTGNSGSSFGLGSNYQVGIDQDARITADANLRGRRGNLRATLTRNSGENPYGGIGVRGGLVLVGGSLIASRPVSDTLLVVRAKELADSEIYIPPDTQGRTRFDGDGFGVLTDLPNYRRVNLAFDQSLLPLGMEITQDKFSGSLRPHRGYVIDVPVRQLQPVRLHPKLPADSFGRGNAVSGNNFAPIELDGSLYFNSWPDPALPLEVSWTTEKGAFSCLIELPPEPAVQADGSAFDLIELRDVECKSAEDK